MSNIFSHIDDIPESHKIEFILSCAEIAFGSECRNHKFTKGVSLSRVYTIGSTTYGVVAIYFDLNKFDIVQYKVSENFKLEQCTLDDKTLKSLLRKFKIGNIL